MNKDNKTLKTLKFSIAAFSILSIFNFIGIANTSYALLNKSVDSKNSIEMKTSNMQFDFDYTGGEQIFTVPYDEKYADDHWGVGEGGSSFISGHNGCVAIAEDSTEDNIKQRTDSNGKTCTDRTTDITCSYHYSWYKFTDTVMIDGAGYNWTTVKGDYVRQPQPDGTITTGHSGNGYARITYLGN